MHFPPSVITILVWADGTFRVVGDGEVREPSELQRVIEIYAQTLNVEEIRFEILETE